MSRVMGLDISAQRIAWALCNGDGECWTGIRKRGRDDFVEFVYRSRLEIEALRRPYAFCLEVNLHPKITYKGHPSPKMVEAYQRSRWPEGALLYALGIDEPLMITKLPGGFHKIPTGHVFALQASGGKDAKLRRRQRMTMIYKLQAANLSEDECDALAVSHECACALATGVRQAETK